MGELRYSMLQDDWTVEADQSFVSPLIAERPEQTVVFADRLRNGSLSAEVTLLESDLTRNGQPAMEANLVVRYTGPDGSYYAGTGAFDTRFFVGKTMPGPLFQSRAYVGRSTSLHLDKTYHLRLEFSGNQITLYENNVQHLVVLDESYQTGQCALRTFGTSARFSNVRIERATPKAFIIMPFASELDFVHEVLQRTVESYHIDCVRADEMAIARPVIEDVKAQIAAADIVLVDFTGSNPNVYYEAGLADAWKKDWIVLAQSTDDLTFDVRHIRTINYTNTMGADVKLEKDLRRAIEALGYGRAEVARDGDPPKGGDR
jgi:hypothetical protein